ncbi:flagellar protein FliT [Virgibacillus salexigens]|uniref:flagellar protein FliT n=1 Tax=Virgibacillus salexigens TaxID=61016 RepID=UPI00190C6DFD|nr:flagellar protein FliT [Virgibacillus salexigens]
MNRLTTLYQITLELKEVLDNSSEYKQRESLISRVNTLIEQRGKEMEQIVPPFSDEENRMGKAIVALHQPIETLMHQLFNELKSEMRQVKKQKKSNRQYKNPYAHMQSIDGMFLDRKK